MTALLALGDSYTCGEGVAPAEAWPRRLADWLGARGVTLDPPHIVAVTGWTVDELLGEIARSALDDGAGLVTVLAGVNDQYRGHAVDAFRPSYRRLLQRAVACAGGDAGRVLAIAIPDWSATPIVAGRDAARVAAEIAAFNAAAEAIARAAGVTWVDIVPLSRPDAVPAPAYTDDGLHPSAGMYRRWVEDAIGPAALRILAGG